ncbi:MAG TPA: NosD domain-containing protein, partial [Thermoplasmata archaeon]|nr:NosD domain-containing protein [Thermoplasmata archaeon]
VSLPASSATGHEDPVATLPASPAVASYSLLTPHAPIRIESDTAFNASNGVTGGNGSAGNPYIISGWSIQRNGTTHGILVANTTKRFVISDVDVVGADQKADGIHFRDLANGTVRNASLRDHRSGINLQRAHDVNAINISTDSNVNGVLAEYSHRATLSDSRFDASIQYAVLFSFSNDSAVLGSTFTMGSESGILYDATYRFRVENSTFTGGRSGLELSASRYGHIWGNTLKDISGDGMLIQSANYNLIARNRIINDSVGILALISFYNTFDDNIVESCYNGWLFDNIFSSTLRRNRISNSTLYGLQLATSGLNLMENNTMTGNYYDFDLRPSWRFPETMDNDIDQSNVVSGGKVFVARDTKDPQVPNDAGFVALSNVSGKVSGLNVSRQGKGVLVAFSRNLTLSDSRFTSTAQGVSIVGSRNVTVKNMSIADSYEAAVFFHGTQDSVVTGAKITGANLSGIQLWESSRNRVESSEVTGTKAGPGMLVNQDSDSNAFTRNVIRGSKTVGLEISDRSRGNVVAWNDFIANKKQADDFGPAGRNWWNGSDRGNFWSDHNATDADCDGALDLFYIIGSKGSRDFKPQVKSISAAVKPCHPTGLKTKVSGTEVRLSWVAPKFDGDSTVSKYSVYRRTGGGAPALAGTSNSTSHIDDAPDPNVTYLYSVAAVNAMGEGPRSAETEATTTWIPPKLPDAAAAEIVVEPAEVYAGDASRIRGTVMNLGDGALESAHARLMLGDAASGTQLASIDVPSLAPGERFDLTAPWTAVAGANVFTLVVENAKPADTGAANNELSLPLQITVRPGPGDDGSPGTPRANWSPALLAAAAGMLALALVLAVLAMRRKKDVDPIADEAPEIPVPGEKKPEADIEQKQPDADAGAPVKGEQDRKEI